eukprot:TRINITY_DN16624_c0_g1_i1.p1 TRINITY_DN16624_c0_g1~~TRINITY_DN16624_c0_g1_i1.p1  ORF type:complete len:126 (-),score=20.06 TRINITY_DN16624_c0_g1_i1:128-505(-)
MANRKLRDAEEYIQLEYYLSNQHRTQRAKSLSVEALSTERKFKEDLNAAAQNLFSQNEALQNDLKEWISTAETNSILVNTLEQKIKQISDEKKDYEALLTRYVQEFIVEYMLYCPVPNCRRWWVN